MKPGIIQRKAWWNKKTIEENRTKEFNMDGREIQIDCYADDSVLIVENKDDLQWLVQEFNINAEKMNLRTSAQKTKNSMIFK